MSCFPCFGSKESESNEQEDFRVAQTKGHPSSQSPVNATDSLSAPANQTNSQKQEGAAAADTNEASEIENSSLHNFGFRELAMATKNFRRECLLGESRVGKVYKGTLQGTGQVVAVKQLDRHGTKANKEFLAQVMILSLLRHPNLAELIGYCADGDQRILVFEYMERGSLNNHLHEVPPERDVLDWITRMKIASGAAQALEYLHEKANPPILCRNFKSTNIMLDEIFEPKLTDYGLVRLEIDSGNTMNQRIVCTVGCAPEYEQNGELTPKSDVYSFGIVLLELITGRKALETTLPVDEQNLVIWAQPYFKEPKRFPEMVDPQLKGAFPDKSLNQAVGVAAMCVQDDPSVRPMISDVVAALSFLTMAPSPQVPQTEPAPSTNSTHEETRSSSSSEDPEQELEEASSQNDGSEDFSYSDSDDEDDQSPIRIKDNKTRYNEDRGGTSSSESLYNEDDYDDDEEQQEETNYSSKSRPKSIKRKVSFEKEKRSVSRNSSKSNNKSFKTHLGSSLRKKSENRISSRNNSKRVDGSLSKKSHDVTKDDENSSKPFTSKNSSTSRSNKTFKTHLDSSSNKKDFDTKSSKNNERVNVSLSKQSHPDNDQSSSEPYKLNNRLSSRRSSKNDIQSHSRRPKSKKSETRNTSFSSDSDESSRRIVTNKSTRKNMGGSDSSMNNRDVDILEGGEELNARLFEDTYVPI